MTKITTAPITSDRWDDVVAVFGRRGRDPTWCWCQRFMDTPPGLTNREALRIEVTSAPTPPGVIAYVDGTPAGWSRVMPRNELHGIQRNSALRRVLDDDPDVWWITCFSVDPKHRSLGVATALLDAAVRFAADHGGSALEGHPVDVDALQADRPSPASLFTGTMRTFVASGFREIGRTYPSRPVMRCDLH